MRTLMRPMRTTSSCEEAFKLFLSSQGPRIRGFALRIVPGDDALRREVEQAALIALWRVDASRFGDADTVYLLIRLRDRMKDAKRAVPRRWRYGRIRCDSYGDMEELVADISEPPYMRRARGSRWDPQDPTTIDY